MDAAGLPSGATQVHFAYDGVGNRIQTTDSVSGLGKAFTYGMTNNKLVSTAPTTAGAPGAATTQTYDAMGSLINDGFGMSLGYDVTGRLVETTRTPSSTSQAYNLLGQRVRKTTTGAGSGTQLYAYDETGQLLGAYTVDPMAAGGFTVEEELVWLGEDWRPVATVRPDAALVMSAPVIYPVLTDHLGTPRKMLDPATGFTWWDWDAKEPFGRQAPNSDPSGVGDFVLDARFPGQRFDAETGLYHNGFRDYHAGLGRYVQSDPLGLEAGWNTYAYAGSGPLGASDPLGLDWRYDISNGISAIDEGIVQMLAKMEAKPINQNVVDASAGWGDSLSTIPFTDMTLTKWIRLEAGTSDAVNCASDMYSLGQVGGAVHGAALSMVGGIGVALKVGQRNAPAGMAIVSRWGRPGLKSGDWVAMGPPNRLMKALSGVVGYKGAGTMHTVPKSSLVNPLMNRPANEPRAVAYAKNFFGLNHIQKIYKP